MAPNSPSRALAFGLVLLVSGTLTAAAAAEPPSDEEHAHNAFKGFELYSWRDGSGHCAYAFLPEPTCQPGGADSDSGTLKPR